jgi:Di-haem oxidoreductase, putative peroxidase
MFSFLVLRLGVMAVGLGGIAQQPANEAPAGFDTPTLAHNPGSQSKSTGIAEPPGDTYDGANSIAGRSIINDRAVVPQAQEHIPVTENIRALRAALNTLGDGFVEAIDGSMLLAIAQNQPDVPDGKTHGEAVQVPVLEAPGQRRIGRFGWKDQHSSLLSFIGDAYLNEMGVTNRLRPHNTTTVGKITPDPENEPNKFGLADIDHFAQFVRGTKVPPRDATLAATPAAQVGQALFEQIRCNTCHVETITTAPAETVINGGQFSVPEALGNKIIHPYSFSLHDVGTGDGLCKILHRTLQTNCGHPVESAHEPTLHARSQVVDPRKRHREVRR